MELDTASWVRCCFVDELIAGYRGPVAGVPDRVVRQVDGPAVPERGVDQVVRVDLAGDHSLVVIENDTGVPVSGDGGRS